ncbi:MAG: caspase family protein [Thermoanaerobaculia bacterium]
MSRRRGRFALLVGIDCYPNFKSQLRSCANDARLLAEVLRERFGFPEERVTLLLDQAATRQGILEGLAALRLRARPDDAVVFFYSGHGSQVPDREGDEPDGLDESIVPHDGGRDPHPFRDITDDEIYAWVLGVSEVTPNVAIIVDTCYSGTLAREGREKWVAAETRRAEELPPSPVPAGLFGPRARDAHASGLLPIGDRYVLFAACRVEERAKELPLKPGVPSHSVFTFHLCQALQQAPARATYRDLLEPVRAAVAASAPDQTPQLEGARDRLLFGMAVAAPTPFLEVRERAGERLRLGGGAVHGVTPGSLWAVHPSGAREIDRAAQPLGLALVDRVHAVSSEAEIVEEASPIGAGTRAVERSKGPGWLRLPVAVSSAVAHGKEGKVLSRRLGDSPLLLLVADGEGAEVRIESGEGGAGAATWVAVDQEGEAVLPAIAAGAVAPLIADLERLARYRNLLRLEDEDPRNPLRGSIEVQLLRCAPDGSARPARPDLRSGRVVYHEGERLAIRVRHRHRSPLFVHVLDLGLTGAGSLLYPVRGANESLEPKRELLVGVRAGDEIEVHLPEGFTGQATANGEGPRQGVEHLKVFATTHETDLSWLEQPASGPRFDLRVQGKLARLVWRAARGRPIRDDAPLGVDEEEHWTVVTLGFLVREKRGARGDSPVAVGAVS